MTSYSLIKVGNDYVVRADHQCVLKVSSRRRAAQLISNATVLLTADAAKEGEPSLHRETPEAP